MQHPSQKFNQFQLIMLLVAFIFGILFFIRPGFSFFLLFLVYALAGSFVFEGLAHQSRNHMPPFIIQMIRAGLLVIFGTILFFY
ncbi:hypothetical protein ACFFGV_16475 [Pontibacillus salicampi]|uniref:Uncharacterized protein n=1 Tax=Pontibacillus salicampi TaxID=1449801 RepID=A0ABV6LSE0_9BACI